MSQSDIILRELKKSYPAGIDALDIFKIGGGLRASARIYDLRQSGHKIETYVQNGHDHYRLLMLPQGE